MNPWELFLTLRKWRNEKAEARNVPPYRICPDYELAKMAADGNTIKAAWDLVGRQVDRHNDFYD